MADPTRTQLPFLASLVGRRDPEARRILLRVATDRFVNEPVLNRETIGRFEKEALPLLLDSDPHTRLIVARKLAPLLTAPAALLETILAGGGEAALTVLQHAVAIDRERLIAAACGEVAEAVAVAKRTDLDEELARLLAARPEAAVVFALADNASAPIPADLFALLARQAACDERLARALLARSAAPLDQAALFLYASSPQRAAMLLAAQRAEMARTPAPAWPGGAEAAAKLERQALARQPAQFVATLAAALGCSPDLAERIVAEPSGEALAVALAALGAPEDATMRILLLGDAVNLDYKRLGALTRLKDALHPAAARRIVAAIVGVERPHGAAATEPVLDSTAASAPSRASPGRTGLPKPDAAQVLRRRRAFALGGPRSG